MRISLKDFGGFLSSPELGKRIGVSVLDSIRKEPEVNVIIDFSGVQGVNRHFCEEFLTLVFRGIGFEEFRKKVIMQNQAAVVKMVFDSVINQKKGIEAEGIDKV
ncbi:MAG: STAS-like domain-containing protein, partial [Deltaproteobacteria bacterium]|nr:STAS-like domain-containing protein [Deltaproteobacteria bacterium]